MNRDLNWQCSSYAVIQPYCLYPTYLDPVFDYDAMTQSPYSKSFDNRWAQCQGFLLCLSRSFSQLASWRRRTDVLRAILFVFGSSGPSTWLSGCNHDCLCLRLQSCFTEIKSFWMASMMCQVQVASALTCETCDQRRCYCLD